MKLKGVNIVCEEIGPLPFYVGVRKKTLVETIRKSTSMFRNSSSLLKIGLLILLQKPKRFYYHCKIKQIS